jgi:RNA polymerase sigma factor (sigma-70 family)
MQSSSAVRETPGSGPDVRSVPDEQLVNLAQKVGHRPARDELLSRLSAYRDKLVARLARDAGLDEASRMDAQQDAVFWTLEAIQRFHTERADCEGCHFRTFLHRVITYRFVDSLRRGSRHRPRGGPPRRGRTADEQQEAVDPAALEPPQEVGTGEQIDRLRGELDRLPEANRRLAELISEGLSVAQISATLNASYDVTKRQRRKLLVRLRKALG